MCVYLYAYVCAWVCVGVGGVAAHQTCVCVCVGMYVCVCVPASLMALTFDWWFATYAFARLHDTCWGNRPQGATEVGVCVWVGGC